VLPRPTRHIATIVAALAFGVAASPAQAAPDPLLNQQWGLEQAITGAPEAWTQSHGAGVLVAILDSGVQLNHPDLAKNLWRNPNEIPGNNVDDDHNGYVDDVNGANIKELNGNVEDDNGHGTHVAGIVAAQAGNGVGGSGIAPDATIMAVKVLDANRSGDSSRLAKGIVYAVDRGAKILNVSINGDGTSGDLDAALKYAGSKGATVVASAGNNSRDIDVTPSYPASSTEPAVLVATATTPTGTLISIANRGLRSIDLAAPGGSILSTARGGGYELREGTSMAAPFVAGSLALLAGARPDLPQSTLRDALVQSAPRPSLLSGLLGGGALNVAAALHRVLPGSLWKDSPTQDVALALGESQATLEVSSKSRVRKGRSATVRWTATGAANVVQWRVSLNGKSIKTLPGTTSALRKRVNKAGANRWKVVGLDAEGETIVAATRKFKVVKPG
jgi:subtilisin family serine protease